MIDPNIALSYHPQVQLQDPMQSMGQAMSMYALANRAKLEQQQVAQNDIQMKTNVALNAAIAKNTKQADDGTTSIDYNGVAKTMSDLGFGKAGQDYRQKQQEADLTLSKMRTDQLLQLGDVQKAIADNLSSVRSIADPQQRQAAWNQRRQQVIQTYKADPNSIPQQVPDDPTLASMEASAMDAHQRISLQIQKQTADTQLLREKDNQKRVDAYYDWMTSRGDMNRYHFTNQYDKDNHPIILDTQTGQVMVDKNITGAPWADPTSSSRGRGVTPDAALSENRANQNDYEKNATAEITTSQQRNALDAALKNGKMYVYQNGRTVPFSSMKNSDGSPLSADDIAAFQQEMQQRKVGLEKAVETAVSNKNNAMLRNGVRPQVSTQQAIQSYRKGWGYNDQPSGGGAPAPAVGSGAAQPPAAVVAQMPVGKVTTFRNGQKWIKNADGSVQQVTQ